MDFILYLVDFILHVDVHLGELIRDYGALTYGILFLIIFCETGLVVLPLLPGDSLLFAAGAFGAKGDLDPHILFLLLSIAAFLGDSLNYYIGKKIGVKAYTMNSRFIKKEYEAPTIGILLCHRKNDALVELTLPKEANIHASEYQLYLPSKDELKRQLEEVQKDRESENEL